MTTLTGTMLVPGVSRNGRLYTPELIKKAHARLAERIKDGTSPATMLTHHDASDDSTRIVGRITGVKLNGDNLDFTAETAPTDHGQTIQKLVGAEMLRNVSIRGYWLGPVETKMVDGQQVTTADDLEIDGVDFTKSPGVLGATVQAGSAPTETDTGRVLITETLERVAFTEQAPTAEAKTAFADPGYLADKVKRYPIGTREQADQAAAHLAENSDRYTANQLKRVRGRIKAAQRTTGDDMTETVPAALGETSLSECLACYDDRTGTAGFSISAYNGPLTVSVSAYNGIEPADLAGVAQAAMNAACMAIAAMDPDVDGDIDTGAAEVTTAAQQRADNDMESAPTKEKEALVAETQAPEATTEAAPAAETETTTETVAAVEIDYDKLAEAVIAKQAAATTETEPAKETTTETVVVVDEAAAHEALLAEAKAAVRADIIKESIENGTISRKGRVRNLAEDVAPTKPLHEMSADELRAETARVMVPAVVAVDRG